MNYIKMCLKDIYYHWLLSWARIDSPEKTYWNNDIPESTKYQSWMKRMLFSCTYVGDNVDKMLNKNELLMKNNRSNDQSMIYHVTLNISYFQLTVFMVILILYVFKSSIQWYTEQ